MNNEQDITSMWPKIEFGYSNRPIRQRRAVSNVYLDNCAVHWISMMAWTPSWTSPILLPLADNNYIAAMSANLEQANRNAFNKTIYWNLTREITPTGWLKIPEDGSYSMTFQRVYRTDKSVSGAAFPFGSDANGIDRAKELFAFTNVEKEWDPVNFFVYLNGQTAVISPNVTSTNYTTALSKGVVLYMFATIRWVWETIPVIWSLYITKIS